MSAFHVKIACACVWPLPSLERPGSLSALPISVCPKPRQTFWRSVLPISACGWHWANQNPRHSKKAPLSDHITALIPRHTVTCSCIWLPSVSRLIAPTQCAAPRNYCPQNNRVDKAGNADTLRFSLNTTGASQHARLSSTGPFACSGHFWNVRNFSSTGGSSCCGNAEGWWQRHGRGHRWCRVAWNLRTTDDRDRRRLLCPLVRCERQNQRAQRVGTRSVCIGRC